MSKKTALLVWGGWEGHEPGKCADMVEGILIAEGIP
jgi:type 1 glutamine amidotransferase